MSLTAGISSAKATWELLRTAVDARDESKIKDATLALREQLFAMSDLAMGYVERNALLTQSNAALTLEKVGLEKVVAELEQKARENEQYVLHEFPTGTLALRYEPAVRPSQKPMHYLCLACKNEGQHTVLQPHRNLPLMLICQANKDHYIAVKVAPPAAPSPPRPRVRLGRDW